MHYQPTMPQMMHAQFGVEALDKASSYSKRDLTAKWRMPAVDDGHGGHGMDEMQRTSHATSTLSTMSTHASDDQLVRSAAILSMDRVDTSALAWFTSDGELGGHPVHCARHRRCRPGRARPTPDTTAATPGA